MKYSLTQEDSGIWINPAERCVSPNFNERPPQISVDMLVVHSISLPPGEFGVSHIKSFFQNKLDPDVHPYFTEIEGLKVSAHLLIDRHGGVIQFVPFCKRAWHAGQSTWQGVDNCNDFSIGIELVGDDNTDYTDQQYGVLAEVTLCLAQFFKIKESRILGHSDIAPDRKTDPGPAFLWNKYFKLLKQ